MVNPDSPDFAAHKPTTVEIDGEIMPSYEVGTPNAPIYPPTSQRDTEIPHDMHGEIPVSERIAKMKEALGALEPRTPRDERHITLGYLSSRGYFRDK